MSNAERYQQALAAASASTTSHESDSGLSPYQARRPALAAVELDENSKRGLSGTHRQRKYRRAAVAIAAQKREHAAQAHPLGGILFCARRHGPHARRRRNVDRAEIRRRAGWPEQLRQVFNDTDDEVLWLIVGAPEELEFLQGSKSKMDLSLIYPVDPTQLPKELAGMEWPPKDSDE